LIDRAASDEALLDDARTARFDALRWQEGVPAAMPRHRNLEAEHLYVLSLPTGLRSRNSPAAGDRRRGGRDDRA
jgi:hypothetical protein